MPHAFYPNDDTLVNETLDADGKRHHVYAAFYPDGTVIEAIQYVHGVRHGPYARNYRMRYGAAVDFTITGRYADDKKIGVWTLVRIGENEWQETLYARTFYKKDGSENGIRLIYDAAQEPCGVEAVCGGRQKSLISPDPQPMTAEDQAVFGPALRYLFEINKGGILKAEDLFALRKVFIANPAFKAS